MSGALERVLELVAQGRLTAQEAAPLLDALDREQGTAAPPPAGEPASQARPATALRVEVHDKGRQVVNLRVAIGLGRAALDRLPACPTSRRSLSPRRSAAASRDRSSRWTTTATASAS